MRESLVTDDRNSHTSACHFAVSPQGQCLPGNFFLTLTMFAVFLHNLNEQFGEPFMLLVQLRHGILYSTLQGYKVSASQSTLYSGSMIIPIHL